MGPIFLSRPSEFFTDITPLIAGNVFGNMGDVRKGKLDGDFWLSKEEILGGARVSSAHFCSKWLEEAVFGR